MRYGVSGARILRQTRHRDLAVFCCNTFAHCGLLLLLPDGTRQSLAKPGHKLVVRDGSDFARFDLPISFNRKSQSFFVFDLCWQLERIAKAFPKRLGEKSPLFW